MIDEDEVIFYNLNLTNDGNTPIQANVINQLGDTILGKPREYEMSIVRFQISAGFIPLFKPTIIAGVSQTNMSITLRYAGTDFQQFINIDTNEQKYGVYNIGIYLDHLNVSSGLAFAALKAAFPGASGTEAPRFYLGSGLISMYVQNDYLESNGNRIAIGFNQVLSDLMNLPVSVYNGAGNVGGFDNELAVRGYSILLPAAGARVGFPADLSALAGTWLQVSQEFPSLSNWNNVKGIQFQTSSIPVAKEYAPTIYGGGQNSNVNNNSVPILTDFELVKDNIYVTRGLIQYLPTAEYRMITMYGTSPLNKIDCYAYYLTMDGRSFPVFLPPGGNMSMKIMFRRKHKRLY